jgi:hypothetical protein
MNDFLPRRFFANTTLVSTSLLHIQEKWKIIAETANMSANVRNSLSTNSEAQHIYIQLIILIMAENNN